MIKRFYAEDNASLMVVITDGIKAIGVPVYSKEEAFNMDFSGIEGCETMEEVEHQTSIKLVDFIEEQFDILEEIK